MIADRRKVFASVLAVALCLSLLRVASANMAKWWHEGEGHGPLVPQKDTSVRVDSEALSFMIAPSLDSLRIGASRGWPSVSSSRLAAVGMTISGVTTVRARLAS